MVEPIQSNRLNCTIQFLLILNWFFRADRAKKEHYGGWFESDLLPAVVAYKRREYPLIECVFIYSVPTAMLIEKKSITNEKKEMSRQPMLFLDWLSWNFDVAEKYSLPRTVNKDKKTVGRKWFYAFMNLNPQRSLRKPKGTFRASAKRSIEIMFIIFLIFCRRLWTNMHLLLTPYLTSINRDSPLSRNLCKRSLRVKFDLCFVVPPMIIKKKKI